MLYFFLFQAFMTYDVEHNLGVTKGEFRRVLESFCVPLTSEQFEAVVAKVHNSVLVDYLKCETHFNPNLLIVASICLTPKALLFQTHHIHNYYTLHVYVLSVFLERRMKEKIRRN